MRPRFLICEGDHASGSSTHADALAAGLRSRGIDARAYHHPRHPAGCDGVARVVWYAGAREEMRRREDALSSAGDDALRVIVLDRGPLSGVVYANALPRETLNRATAINTASEEYAREPWRSAPVAILDAADDALDARLRERGEDPAASHAERHGWRRMIAACGWARRVRTDRDADVVRAELLAWALREVGR